MSVLAVSPTLSEVLMVLEKSKVHKVSYNSITSAHTFGEVSLFFSPAYGRATPHSPK
jgi:hypothetical protein